MNGLSHLDEFGAVRMVDVAGKEETARSATAEGRIRMNSDVLDAILSGKGTKGDALAAARIAAIMAAKRTGEIIPLCHPLGLESIEIEFTRESEAIRVTATVGLVGKTGVEMEAMTAVSVALLTLYDMGKALDRSMVIDGVRLLAKCGGKSGPWRAAD